ncbi:MAG: 50S ribosomal protein L30 [Acidobacteriota bacterium]|nr:50S ribosomal protein L30 [Acidobacteriota bacterium]
MTEKQAAPRAKKPRAAKSERRGVLRLRLARSKISTPVDQKATVRALGFRRVGQIVEMEDGPATRGRIRKVRHLVEILEGGHAPAGS